MFKTHISHSLLLALLPLAAFVGVGADATAAETTETTPRIEVEVETVRATPHPWGQRHHIEPEVIYEESIHEEYDHRYEEYDHDHEEVEYEVVKSDEEFEEFELILPAEPAHDLVGTFACVESPYSDVAPTTVFYSPEGALPVIHWVSDYFAGSGYDPLTRCRQVSDRFERYYEAGVLNYITTGIVNRLPVICVSDEMGGSCQGVLLTLKPGQNASFVVQRLFDLSYGRQVGALYESGSRIYIDVENYLSGLEHLESSR
ncbi:MAG: COP23 domain-containing protein [Cyanobacteria bacterium P01_B01_bin.77]